MTVPTIINMTPQGASEGDSITLSVTGLDTVGAGSSVSFAGVLQTTFTTWLGSTIVCDVPLGILEENRIIDIIVTNDDGLGGPGDFSASFEWWIIADDPFSSLPDYQRPDPNQVPKESQTTSVDILAEAKDFNRLRQALAATQAALFDAASHVLFPGEAVIGAFGSVTINNELDTTTNYEQYLIVTGTAAAAAAEISWQDIMPIFFTSINKIRIPYFKTGVGASVIFRVIKDDGTTLFTSLSQTAAVRTEFVINAVDLSSQPNSGERFLILADTITDSAESVRIGTIEVSYM